MPYSYPAAAAAKRAVSSSNRVAFLGDSITGQNGSGIVDTGFEVSGNNYSCFISAIANGRIQYGRAFSTGGFTLAQMRDTLLPLILAQPAATKPGSVVILGGMNDAGLGTFNVNTSITALTDIATQLTASNIQPVLCTVPPRGDDTAARGRVQLLNAHIARLALRSGWPLLDFYAAVVDPITGAAQTAFNLDNIHPTPAGMMAMATHQSVTNWIATLPSWQTPMAKNENDAYNQTGAYGLFRTDTNSDGVADGWASGGAGTSTLSLVTPGANDDCAGNWQRVTVTSADTASSKYLQCVLGYTAGYAVGDLMAMTCRIRWSGIAGFPNNQGPTINFTMRNGGSPSEAGFFSGRDVTGVVYVERRITTSNTAFAVTLGYSKPSTGTMILDIGQVTVRNLTQMGLA
jgi:lysophospholipase L1-like esterase